MTIRALIWNFVLAGDRNRKTRAKVAWDIAIALTIK